MSFKKLALIGLIGTACATAPCFSADDDYPIGTTKVRFRQAVPKDVQPIIDAILTDKYNRSTARQKKLINEEAPSLRILIDAPQDDTSWYSPSGPFGDIRIAGPAEEFTSILPTFFQQLTSGKKDALRKFIQDAGEKSSGMGPQILELDADFIREPAPFERAHG